MLCFPTCLLSCLMMGVLMLKYVVKMALMLPDLAASFRDMLLCFLVVCFLCFVKSKDRRCWVSVRAKLVLHNISKSFRNLLWQNQSGAICVWTLWKRETQMHAYTWRHPCGGGKKRSLVIHHSYSDRMKMSNPTEAVNSGAAATWRSKRKTEW